MIMAVQRKWMYLESIFVGSEDIRKQLPSESSLFDRVNADWISTTKRMQAAGTAYKAAHLDGALELLVQMDDTLDRIQKSLDEYLETKRQGFARFYFISNDDLLDILGQARDPTAVQPHVRKCFEGSSRSTCARSARRGARLEALGSRRLRASTCGSRTRQGDVLRAGRGVPRARRACAHAHQGHVPLLPDMKKTKREKWITLGGPAHALLGQISWTAECTKALHLVPRAPRGRCGRPRSAGLLLIKLCDMVRGSWASSTASGRQHHHRGGALARHHLRMVLPRARRSTTLSGCCSCASTGRRGRRSGPRQADQHADGLRLRVPRHPARLVVTPLTDRCYTTLTTALHLHCGGLPQAPRARARRRRSRISKNLAKQCIVFNCSTVSTTSRSEGCSRLAQTARGVLRRVQPDRGGGVGVAQQILCIPTAFSQGRIASSARGARSSSPRRAAFLSR